MSPFRGHTPQRSSLGQLFPPPRRFHSFSGPGRPHLPRSRHPSIIPDPSGKPAPLFLTQAFPLPRSFSLDPLMERRWDLDLTYVTERILAAAFPARPDEQRHRGHLRELAHVLQSKHRDKYLVRGGACHNQLMRELGNPDGPWLHGTSNPRRRGPEVQGTPTGSEDHRAATAGQGLSNFLILKKELGSQWVTPPPCIAVPCFLRSLPSKALQFLAALQPFRKKT